MNAKDNALMCCVLFSILFIFSFVAERHFAPHSVPLRVPRRVFLLLYRLEAFVHR